MKNLIYILLFFAVSLQAQDILIFNASDADSLRKTWGEFSALDPIALPDGTYMLPSKCLIDPDLSEAYNSMATLNVGVNEILDLPEIGEIVEIGKIYKYFGNPNLSPLIKCVQTHNLTNYPPYDTPALFTFFRENSDTLTWIENECVYVDWKRVWEEVAYTVIQEHMTVTGQTPDLVPALWVADVDPCSDWVQPTGGHDAYNIGDCVLFNGNTYESLINSNVWSPAVYPAGWQQL